MRAFLCLLMLSFVVLSSGQPATAYTLSPEEAVSLALDNHPLILNQSLKARHDHYALRSSWDLDPAGITYRSGELYSAEKDKYLVVYQNFGSLMQHVSDYRLAVQQVKLDRTELEIRRKNIIAEVKSAYYSWVHQHNRLKILEQQQELYSDLTRIADLKYRKGEIDLAEKTSLINEAAHSAAKRDMACDELEIAANNIRQLAAISRDIVPSPEALTLYETEISRDTSLYSDQLLAGYYNGLSEMNALTVRSRSATFFPDVSLGFIRQEIGRNSGLWAWQVGLAFPLYFPSRLASVKKARIEAEMAVTDYDYQLSKINTAIQNLVLDLNRTFREIAYYDRYALVQASQLSERAWLQFENEEIEYVEYVRQMERSSSVMLNYLDIVNRYNQTAIQLECYAP